MKSTTSRFRLVSLTITRETRSARGMRDACGQRRGGDGGEGHCLELLPDEAFSCVVKSQKRRSNKIYKIKLTKIRYKIK